jgi:hypothetical protein
VLQVGVLLKQIQVTLKPFTSNFEAGQWVEVGRDALGSVLGGPGEESHLERSLQREDPRG